MVALLDRPDTFLRGICAASYFRRFSYPLSQLYQKRLLQVKYLMQSESETTEKNESIFATASLPTFPPPYSYVSKQYFWIEWETEKEIESEVEKKTVATKKGGDLWFERKRERWELGISVSRFDLLIGFLRWGLAV